MVRSLEFPRETDSKFKKLKKSIEGITKALGVKLSRVNKIEVDSPVGAAGEAVVKAGSSRIKKEDQTAFGR